MLAADSEMKETETRKTVERLVRYLPSHIHYSTIHDTKHPKLFQWMNGWIKVI